MIRQRERLDLRTTITFAASPAPLLGSGLLYFRFAPVSRRPNTTTTTINTTGRRQVGARMVNTTTNVAAAGAAAVAALERWVVTVCGTPIEGMPLALRGAIEGEVLKLEGSSVGEWRRLGVQAYELVCTVRSCDEELLRRGLADITDGTTTTTIAGSSSADVVLQEEAHVRGGKALAVFDLDSTLIAEETIDELAKEMGASDKVRALTEQAMAGTMGFREALYERVATLEGLPIAALERVKSRATCTPGAYDTIRALKAIGCTTAVVSGGFTFLAEHIRDTLGIDYSFSNTLELTSDGKLLTGRTIGPIVDAEFKANTLTMLAEKLDIPKHAIMAVGDGSNDLIMLQRAGLGVAFNAKPLVQKNSKARVNQPSLRNCLYLLGLDDHQILQHLSASNTSNNNTNAVSDRNAN